jgi:HK97 family phage portal protein
MDRRLSLQLASGLQKALGSRSRMANLVNQQLFRTSYGIAPIAFDDEPEKYIDEGYSYNPDVYSVVNGITGAASSVPAVVHEVVDEKSAREYYQVKKNNRYRATARTHEQAYKLRKKAFELADPESDLVKLIDTPNPLQSWPEFVENAIGFKKITGNTYIHGNELSDGRFGELWLMPPQLTQIVADKSTETIIKSYILDIYGYNQPIPVETVLHLKHWNPDYTVPGSHLYGMSPLKAGRRSVIASNEGLMAISKALSNSGASGMLYPADPDITELTAEQRAQLQRWFDQNKKGSENYKSALITTAKMGWTPFGMSPIDLEIIESRKMTTRDICNIYKYPSALLNDPETKTNANVGEARKQLYQDVVVPELEHFYSSLNRWLVPRFNKVSGKKYHIDYDLNAVEALADDMKEKTDWLNTAWWIPPNRKLEEMNFETMEDPAFDEPWVPMNLVPLSDALGSSDLTESEKALLRSEYERNI